MKFKIGFIDHSKFPPNYWKWLAIIGWLLFFIVLFMWLWFPDLEASEIKLSEHFTQSEFSCKCCGETKVNIELIIALEKLRNLVNIPIIITSGYRCPLHNKKVGGVRNSQHLYGNAVDIKVKGYSPTQVAKLAKECGFTWTKAYKTFTHIDVRQIKLAKQ